MIGKKIIDKIIEESLVSAGCECVSVWREDAESVLNDFVNDHISREEKRLLAGRALNLKTKTGLAKAIVQSLNARLIARINACLNPAESYVENSPSG